VHTKVHASKQTITKDILHMNDDTSMHASDSQSDSIEDSVGTTGIKSQVRSDYDINVESAFNNQRRKKQPHEKKTKWTLDNGTLKYLLHTLTVTSLCSPLAGQKM